MQKQFLNGRSLKFLLLSLTAFPAATYANCEMSKEPGIALYVSPESQSWGSFDSNSVITSSTVGKCYEDSGKQLMLTMSLVRPGERSDIKHSYFFNNFSADNCSLENSEVIQKAQASDQADFFSQQFKLLRACFEIRVSDPSGASLSIKDKQEHCIARKNDDGSYNLSGDMCFVKINPRNQFQITPVLREECKTAEGLARLGAKGQDLIAGLDVFVAGDDSGNSEDLTQIGARDIRFNIVPQSQTLALSDDNGPERPRFPAQYNVDVDWGSVAVSKQSDHFNLDVSLFASNIAKAECKGAHCEKTSNFIQPVFGQFQLFEIGSNGKNTLVDEWWDGGFAYPNWQGSIPGMSKSIEDGLLKPRKKYRLQVSFQDPTDDYAIFLSGLKQMLINLEGVQNGVVGLAQIPSLANLQTMGVLPNYSGLGGLGNGELQVNLDEVINGLSLLVKNNIWPAYYDFVCPTSMVKCLKLGNNKIYQNLTMDFTLGEVDRTTGQMGLENFTTQKQSTVFAGYSMAPRALPKLSCEGGGGE